MKKSPSSSCSSSSSSSCAEPEILQVKSEKPKGKRPRKENGNKNQNSASGRRSSIYRGVTRFQYLSHFLAFSLAFSVDFLGGFWFACVKFLVDRWILNADIDGLGGSKLICGIRVRGTMFRTKKDDKVKIIILKIKKIK